MSLTHKNVSIAKSIIRLLACVAGFYSFAYFCLGFALAELLGVLEEIVDLRPETKWPENRVDQLVKGNEYIEGMQCHCVDAASVPHTIGEHKLFRSMDGT